MCLTFQTSKHINTEKRLMNHDGSSLFQPPDLFSQSAIQFSSLYLQLERISAVLSCCCIKQQPFFHLSQHGRQLLTASHLWLITCWYLNTPIDTSARITASCPYTKLQLFYWFYYNKLSLVLLWETFISILS